MKNIETILYGRNILGSYLELHLTDGSRYKIECAEDEMPLLALGNIFDLANRDYND